MRRAVTLLLLAGALAAPASSAVAFPNATFENQCQYSYDGYWRPVPMIFGGKLTDGAGVELAPGAQLAVGDTVRLQDGTVSAILPDWIITFAYDSGIIGVGDTDFPVRAWLALEATNTEQGIVGPIPLTTVARAHVELTAGGVVDEERSSIVVVQAPVATQAWTATGGEVQVRQALGESLPPLPIGRNGADVRVRGSLYVEASLGAFGKLFLDCLQGEQVNQGETHTDALPGAVGVFGVPGWTGAVDGVPVTGPVDADFLHSEGPERAGIDEQAVLSGASLRLRLTDAQREAWVGDDTSVPVSAAIAVDGDRSAEESQQLQVERTVTLPADGPAVLSLPLPNSTWTAATANGIDLRSARVVELEAEVGAAERKLTLTRISPSAPYPFARVLRPGAPLTPIPTPTPTPTPDPDPTPVATASPVPTVAPTATPTPTPAPKAEVSVGSSKLKLASRRVSVSLRCAGDEACKGMVRLRTASKVKLGKKAKRIVTLTGAAKYTVAAGTTATVRLSLSRDGRSLMAKRKSLRVALEVQPTGAKALKRTLTLAK